MISMLFSDVSQFGADPLNSQAGISLVDTSPLLYIPTPQMTIPSSQNPIVRGRCIGLDLPQVSVRHEAGMAIVTIDPAASDSFGLGDIVEVQGNQLRVLTPNRARQSMKWMQQVLHPRRMKAMKVRSQVESGIREFFTGQGFIDARTPLLVPSPGMEPHIRPLEVIPASLEDQNRRAFLPTSPEFAMKRLLVGGLERIFQICPAFRDEPHSVTHHPEFTMLEWYRAYAGYEDIMRDTESLFEALAMKIHGRPVLKWQGQEISVAAPWPRLRVRDLFRDLASVDLVKCAGAEDLARECQRLGLPADLSRETWDDLYFKIWLNAIEPKLPIDRAVFVTRYPESQAALSVIDSDPDGSRWARRFEAYAGGLELGNAFEELTDPVEQRRRFVKDMELRTELYGTDFPKSPLDEGFLGALTEGMPPAGGIAMGVDRIVMLFADEPEIDYTLWLRSELTQAKLPELR
jgi:lysyl-tRNA synthetase class 2